MRFEPVPSALQVERAGNLSSTAVSHKDDSVTLLLYPGFGLVPPEYGSDGVTTNRIRDRRVYIARSCVGRTAVSCSGLAVDLAKDPCKGLSMPDLDPCPTV